MSKTYKAVLRGSRLEWIGLSPSGLRDEEPVEVVICDESGNGGQIGSGSRMAGALEKLAAIDALIGIGEPSAWQRETRRDRELPGRES